jgi:protein TonB
MRQAAGLRLLLALALSAALHLSLIYGIAVGPPQLGPAPALVAQLVPAATARASAAVVDASDAPAAPHPRTTAIPASSHGSVERSAVAKTGDASLAAASEPIQQPPARPEETTLPRADVPLLADPTWYTAQELDVYPRALAPMELAYPSTATSQTGEVWVLAMIDEWGGVRDVSLVKAEPAGDFEEPALQAVRTARFSPAQRDGRAVRSQIVVKLRFEPQMQASAGR